MHPNVPENWCSQAHSAYRGEMEITEAFSKTRVLNNSKRDMVESNLMTVG